MRGRALLPQKKTGGRYREPLRYVAIRVRHKHGELFAGGAAVKYFAVATNVWNCKPQRLVEWHREKQGSIEALHDVLKNESAAGVLPRGRFGANAAWLRLRALTHNLLTAMKRLALPPELLRARPKRLRFLVFTQPGKFVSHARQLKSRLMRAWKRFSNGAWAFEQLPLPAPGQRRLAPAFSLLLLATRRNRARARAFVPESASGRRAQPPGMPIRPAGRGGFPPRALFSEPEDTIRPSDQLPLPLTDGLRGGQPCPRGWIGCGQSHEVCLASMYPR